jgi:hypothetical protein
MPSPTEQTDEEILKLIRSAQHDGEKATLMVLYQINRNLIQNTEMTTEALAKIRSAEKEFASHREDFDKHVQDETALFNKGIGAWKTLSIVSAVVASVGVYILSGHLGDLKTVMAANASQDVEMKRLDSTVRVLEAVVDRNSRIIMERLLPNSYRGGDPMERKNQGSDK